MSELWIFEIFISIFTKIAFKRNKISNTTLKPKYLKLRESDSRTGQELIWFQIIGGLKFNTEFTLKRLF